MARSSDTMTFKWRPMTEADLDAVERIAAIVHPGFFERREVLAEKQRLYPRGAWLGEIDGQASGYLLSHPWHENAVPPLNAALGTIPPDAGTYYIHDLALLQEARGVGAAGMIVQALAKHASAHHYETMALVAVNDSTGFWSKQGFAIVEMPELHSKLLNYEQDARYMVKWLA